MFTGINRTDPIQTLWQSHKIYTLQNNTCKTLAINLDNLFPEICSFQHKVIERVARKHNNEGSETRGGDRLIEKWPTILKVYNNSQKTNNTTTITKRYTFLYSSYLSERPHKIIKLTANTRCVTKKKCYKKTANTRRVLIESCNLIS